MHGQPRNRSAHISTLDYMQRDDVVATTEDSSSQMNDVIFEDRESFKSTLGDLQSNKRALISTLTNLADEYHLFSQEIVQIIEKYLIDTHKENKLNVLYLIDSIMKNHSRIYLSLFSKNLRANFVEVFKTGSNKVRYSLHELRITWTEILPSKFLYPLDTEIYQLDRGWPLDVYHPQIKSQEVLKINDRHATKRRSSEPIVIENAKLPRRVNSSLFGNKDIDLRITPIPLSRDQLATNIKNKSSGLISNVDCQQMPKTIIGNKHQSSTWMNTMPTTNIIAPQSLDALNTSVSKSKSSQSQMKPKCKQESKSMTINTLGAVVNTQIVHYSGNSKIELPPPDLNLLNSIKLDTMSSIIMNGQLRTIRHYGDTAVVFMDNGDPRIIKFQEGTRTFTVNQSTIELQFNGVEMPLYFNEQFHMIKLGTPTRELYIDGQWFQSHFNGQEMLVTIGNQVISASLQGPVPTVVVGDKTDLVVASISLIIDHSKVQTIFLDAKPQIVQIGSIECTLEFVDSLKRVLLNGKPFPVDFGGFEKAIILNGEKHHLRFSKLPKNVLPGHTKIIGMEGEQAIPVLPKVYTDKKLGLLLKNPTNMASREFSSNSPLKINEPVDVLALFQKLVDTGIVPSSNTFSTKQETSGNDSIAPEIPSFDEKFIKNKKNAAKTVKELYDGQPCGNCGKRFHRDVAFKLSDHYDRHFQENMKMRLAKSIMQNRCFYKTVEEWQQQQDEETPASTVSNFFEAAKMKNIQEKITNGTEQPSVKCSINLDDATCVMCYEKFDVYFHQELEEWHYQPTIIYDNKNLHPICLEDYKKLYDKVSSTVDLTVELEKSEAIHMNENFIREKPVNQTEKDSDSDGANETVELHVLESNVPIMNESSNSGTENSDHVEVIEPAPKIIEVVEIEDSSDDEVNATSNNDTKKILETRRKEIELSRSIQRTVLETPTDVPLIFHGVKIKEEPMDNSEMEFDEIPRGVLDSTKVTMLSTIDGNIEFDKAIQIVPKLNPIKLNIINTEKKSVTAKRINTVEKVFETVNKRQKLHPLIPATIKPNLKGKKFSTPPKVVKGEELSSLCSIS
uniref:CID domain-containing protein n=1 Tax=Trichogramma kaykai TaxID=54128 RepID=A0ABD2X1E5_9HYME